MSLKRQNAFFYRRIASAVFYPAHPLFMMMDNLSVELWMLNSMPLLLQSTIYPNYLELQVGDK
ncbi:hypothetical protein V4D05_10165 [Vibrio mimicus]|uniref:hypothetical protein n=1 Tax=Vibrio mimicus TaxID=674 RepID=UPI002F931C0B